MNKLKLRPATSREDNTSRYSHLSELKTEDFDKLFQAYSHLFYAVSPGSRKLTLQDFMQEVREEASAKGYFDSPSNRE